MPAEPTQDGVNESGLKGMCWEIAQYPGLVQRLHDGADVPVLELNRLMGPQGKLNL
jgi:hypothetical protein